MKLVPLLDKIVAKEIKEEAKTESGILLPQSHEEKPILAQIIAVGEGGNVDGEKIEMLVKTGDKIIFSKFAGNEYKLDGETYIILKQADILAKVED